MLLVPSFAIGRTQEVVWQLDRLIERGEIPLLPLYLDSPMASKASDIYRRHPDYYDEETARLLREGATPLDYPNQIVTNDVKESQAIARAAAAVHDRGLERDADRRPRRGHLRNLIDDPTATILFVGYQGQGTLGAHLQAGATEVKIDGQSAGRSLPGPLDQRLLGACRRERAARLARGVSPRASGRATPATRAGCSWSTAIPDAQIALEPKVRALGLRDPRPALARARDARLIGRGLSG